MLYPFRRGSIAFTTKQVLGSTFSSGDDELGVGARHVGRRRQNRSEIREMRGESRDSPWCWYTCHTKLRSRGFKWICPLNVVLHALKSFILHDQQRYKHTRTHMVGLVPLVFSYFRCRRKFHVPDGSSRSRANLPYRIV